MFRQKCDRDPVIVGLRIHRDIGIPAGGEEALDGCADGLRFERVAGLQGENAVQFIGIERLLRRVEPDYGDFPSFELLILRDKDSRQRRRNQYAASE